MSLVHVGRSSRSGGIARRALVVLGLCTLAVAGTAANADASSKNIGKNGHGPGCTDPSYATVCYYTGSNESGSTFVTNTKISNLGNDQFSNGKYIPYYAVSIGCTAPTRCYSWSKTGYTGNDDYLNFGQVGNLYYSKQKAFSESFR